MDPFHNYPSVVVDLGGGTLPFAPSGSRNHCPNQHNINATLVVKSTPSKLICEEVLTKNENRCKMKRKNGWLRFFSSTDIEQQKMKKCTNILHQKFF